MAGDLVAAIPAVLVDLTRDPAPDAVR